MNKSISVWIIDDDGDCLRQYMRELNELVPEAVVTIVCSLLIHAKKMLCRIFV